MKDHPQSIEEFKTRLAGLGDFWESIEFPNGVVVGRGRSKLILWRDYLAPKIDKSTLMGKSILDIGCNAGGNLVELAQASPARLVGLESNDKFLKQAEFVLQQFRISAELIKYKIQSNKTVRDYATDLGRFDVVFMLGVVYHLNRKTNLGVLRYIRENSERCYFSSQTFSPDNMKSQRSNIDWDLTKEGHVGLFREAGFDDLKTIYEKKDSDNWQGLTNKWYFEAR